MGYFGKGLRKLTESGINRIMSHGKSGFIIISANRSEIDSPNKNCDLKGDFIKYCNENGFDKEDLDIQIEWLRIRNNQEDQELQKIIKSSKYGFSPIYGGYHGGDGVNDSFVPFYIVYNHAKGGNASSGNLNFDELKTFALDLCEKFKQDGVYVQGPDEVPSYLDKDGNPTDSSSNENFKFNRDDETYLTTPNKEQRTKDVTGLNMFPQGLTTAIRFENFLRKAGPSSYVTRMQRWQHGEVFLD